MEFEFSKNSLLHMDEVDERLVTIAHLALLLSPIDFGIPRSGGLRTAIQQHRLYLEEKSKCDGYKEISMHQTGRALDVYAYVDGKASWDAYHLTTIAAAFLQAAVSLGHKIEWGGFFMPNGWDKPHFQLLR